MASKFVDLAEAAKMIGVTPDALVEMRSKGAIFGYRDGASWKFKLEEVERVVSERLGAKRGDSSIVGADDDEFENMISGLSSKILAEKAQEESESILVSEQELGVSATGQSTIIGKGKKGKKGEDSDIKLAPDDELSGGSDKLLEAPGSKLNLGSEGSDVLHGSDLKLAGGSGTGDMPGGTGEMPPMRPGSSGGMQLGEAMKLGEEDPDLGSDSAIDDVGVKKGSSKAGSGVGSDVTLGSGDSGINLKPSDSGLSLEDEPLVLGGSSVDELELPEDDDVVSLENEAAADPDQATQLKADPDFMLSPGESQLEDESDSGSQVIALEDSEAFDQDAATMLGQQGAGPLAADAFQPVGGADAAMGGMQAGMPGQPVYVQVPVVEAPYSIWNVLSLALVALMLSLTGMLMVDVMLNMWAFSGTTSVSTSIMDAFIGAFGLNR